MKIVGMGNYTGSVEVELLPCEPEPPAVVPPTITTASLPSATVGEAYSVTLAATGDTPIAWNIQSGTLPAGLSLSGAAISGTPTAAGTFNITVRATNAGGYDEKSFSITVEAAAVEPDEELIYWGHALNDDSEPIVKTLAEYFDWYLETDMSGLGAGHKYIESSPITGTVKEIQFHAGTGYRVILIPQSAGVPARIDDVIGNNVKDGFPMSNITVKGMPYYLFMGMNVVSDTGFMLTIRW